MSGIPSRVWHGHSALAEQVVTTERTFRILRRHAKRRIEYQPPRDEIMGE